MKLPAHVDEQALVSRLARFEIETPSWGYADTGTRFGKFGQDAAATTIEEKLADAAQVHRFTGCCPSVAVHVLWDFPEQSRGLQSARSVGCSNAAPGGMGKPGESVRGSARTGADERAPLGEKISRLARAVAEQAAQLGLRIGALNPNVFQDQCYKWGSVANRDPEIRRRALQHILDCIAIGQQVGSKLLSLWFADGTNYPGQASIRARKRWFHEALRAVHDALPPDWTMLVEYKPFEPACYHTDIADWGMAYVFARQAGPRARVLVDTGHHLPGCNIEQIVAFLIDEQMLGGFHFNDRKYADDDLTMGSIDPYQLFRIFHEITAAEHERGGLPAGPRADLPIAYMIDQSHTLQPKIEAMIQTVMTAQEHFAKALLVDHDALAEARRHEDIMLSERVLKDAYATDVRPLLAEWRKSRNLPPDPLLAFRESGYVERAARERGARKKATTNGYA